MNFSGRLMKSGAGETPAKTPLEQTLSRPRHRGLALRQVP